MYRLTCSGGHFQDKKQSASCLEGLALCLITAVRFLAGAANINAVCCTFAAVSVINAAAHITINAVYSFLFH